MGTAATQKEKNKVWVGLVKGRLSVSRRGDCCCVSLLGEEVTVVCCVMKKKTKYK